MDNWKNPLAWLPLLGVLSIVGVCAYTAIWLFGWIGAMIWITLGAIGHFYWPIRYRKNMKPNDWRYVLGWGLLGILFGPFEFLLGMPL